MILVDSSVWIDVFRKRSTPQTGRLQQLIDTEFLATADLVLAEVLQGIDDDLQFHRVRKRLTALPVIKMVDRLIAVEAAQNYRKLRRMGITIRKTIDTLIATRCIVDGHSLLFSDRDFEPFVEHLGLLSAVES